MDDIFFWKKNGRPSELKDKVRCSLAKYYLSHLKTDSFIMKTIHVSSEMDFYVEPSSSDFHLNIIYSINKNRRWQAESSKIVDLLDQLLKVNHDLKMCLIERVLLKNYSRSSVNFGVCPPRFEEFYPIRTVHYLNDDNEYHQKTTKSAIGQSSSNFSEDEMKYDEGANSRERRDYVVINYNVMRAPNNYMKLLQKKFTPSNYGPRYDWPRAGYWNRLNRGKDMIIDLKYEDFDYLDDEFYEDNNNDDEVSTMGTRAKYYNFEEHLIDNYVIVKIRKRRRRERSL
uniref:Ac57-like protein n=1 Tax=Caenorhabditis tropicalis TaxID=1561998 RepID=A0A1I7T339_9PELO